MLTDPPVKKPKYFDNKTTEEILSYISNLLDNSSSKQLPLTIEDIEVIAKFSFDHILRVTIKNNHYDPNLKDFSYTKNYLKLNEEMPPLTPFNEFTNTELCSNSDCQVEKLSRLQICQMHLYKLNNENKLETYTPVYEDYTFYRLFLLDYDCYYKEDDIRNLLSFRDNIPNLKKYIVIFVVERYKFNEQHIIEKLQEYERRFSETFPELARSYEFTFFQGLEDNIDNKRIKEHYFSTTYYYGLIVDKEGRTVRQKKCYLLGDEPATKIKEFLQDNRTIEENVYILREFNNLKKRLSKVRYHYSIDFSYKVLFSLSKDISEFIPKNIYQCKIDAKLEPEEYNMLNEIKNKFPCFDITNVLIPTFSINFSSLTKEKCSNPSCDTMLTKNDAFYYCYWCRIFYCEKCVEDTFKKETENLREKFIHKKHNLLYITTTDQQYLTNLTREHIGKNKMAEEEDDSLTMEHSGCTCNGCSEEMKNNPRYICVSCRPGLRICGGFCDYCYNCIQHMRNDDEIGKKIQEKIVLKKDDAVIKNYELMEHKHTHRKHIYLMLIAACDISYGYYDF